MKKKKRLSFLWSLLVSSMIFFIFGQFIAPVYEEQILQAGLAEEVVPVSRYSLYLSAALFGGFLLLLVLRLIRKKG
ncbi:MAG: hypothetical protein PVJ98_00770 [Akkermansiaceae bacterium]|jgi:hypothetical protein